MQVFTFKANIKAIAGVTVSLLILCLAVFFFVSNHPAESASGKAKELHCKTSGQRLAYLKEFGWETDGNEASKEITIPETFNEVYKNYNSIQRQQGFDLEKYKGKKAVIYTYKITNYKNNKNVIADLIVSGGTLIGADLCDPAAENGFLTELTKNGKT
ncbi:MAG: DUF4830 domain-containing protein [Eubacterium sp.]|nr:DUF4830 domain-containing protein [Eubacterium sp.]